MDNLIARQDYDDSGRWVGRTWIDGGDAMLVGALFSARRSRNATTHNSVPVFETWTLFNTKSATQPDEYTAADAYLSDTAGGAWHPLRPPTGRYTPPIPLDLYLPVDRGDTPIPALGPWWDHIRVAALPPDGAIAGLSGDELEFSSIKPRGLFWQPALRGETGLWSAVYVTDTHLTAAVTYDIARPDPPVTVGCTIPLGYIHAIATHATFEDKPPKKAPPETVTAMSRRGYGGCRSHYLYIELTDGWRPYCLVFIGRDVPLDQEERFTQFSTWLTRHTAYDRTRQPVTQGHNRARLETIVAADPERETLLADKQLGRRFTIRTRTVIPDHVPVSVELA